MRNGDLLAKELDSWEVIDPVFEEDSMGGEFLTGYMLRHTGNENNTLVFFDLLELDTMLANGWVIVPYGKED